MTDPYAPPASDLSGQPVVSDGGAGPSTRAVQLLRETKPWVRLFAVLLFIGAGFMALAGLGMALVGVIGAFLSSDSEIGAMGGVGGVAMGLVYFLFAAVYVPPALYLWRYGSAIQVLMEQGSGGALEQALLHQRSFWKFVGIAALIMMIAMPLFGVIGAVVAAVAGAVAAG